MTEQAPGAGKGLLGSLTNLAATLVGIAHTRLELLSVDLEEQRAQLLTQLILVLAALFLVGVGVVLAAMLLVVTFWDTHRLLVLGLLTGFFLATGLAAAAVAVYRLRTQPRPFAASLSELRKDRQQLGYRS